MINAGWTSTFYIFTAATVAFIVVFSCFGLVMFVCLQTKPKGAQRIYELAS